MGSKYIKSLFILPLLVLIVPGAFGCSPERRGLPERQLATAKKVNQSGRETPAGAFRFVALGDTGTGGKGQFAVASRMARHHEEHPFDTVLLLGDNIYPHGDASELPTKFEQPYAELLRRGVNFYAVLGNHDVDNGREAQINYAPFNMGGRPYYSFVKGDGLVEFFALDSNQFDPAQIIWLERALAASKARWKIAYLHHPPYSSGMKHGSNEKLRSMLQPLFVFYGVAAVFSGHDHVYERIKPQQGVQYFVSGTGGQLRRGDLNRRSPLFAAGDDEVNSFVDVELTPDHFSFRSIGADGRTLDEGLITPRRRDLTPNH